MREANQNISHFHAKLGGSEASGDFMRDLEVLQIESTVHLPDVAVLIMHDPKLAWVDDDKVGPGQALEVVAKSGETESTIFDGEIVEIESQFSDKSHRLIIRAMDRLHRLSRGTTVRTFQNVTDGDVVKKIAQEVGLTAKVEDSGIVHEYLIQANVTNLQFLRQRAASVGALLFVDGKELHFEPPTSSDGAIELKWGTGLHEFRPRFSTLNQVEATMARGWDPEAKAPVSSESQKAEYLPEIGQKETAAEVAKKHFSVQAKSLVANAAALTEKVTSVLAQGDLNRHAHESIVAEGVAGGTPGIVAGAKVKISGVGNRFSGTYFITCATHNYRVKEGYTTSFSISGQNPNELLSLLGGPSTGNDSIGIVTGMVTDNADPKGQGRVKVKFPWLNDEHTSHWARIISPGAGATRGVEFLPEVNDEVAVLFLQGNMDAPFILGGVWNGKDAPPVKSSEAVSGGKVNKRIIRSRSGHSILLDDSSGKELVLVEDKSGNRILIDSAKNQISVEAKGKILVTAKDKVEIKGNGILIDAGGGKVDVKGSQINLN